MVMDTDVGGGHGAHTMATVTTMSSNKDRPWIGKHRRALTGVVGVVDLVPEGPQEGVGRLADGGVLERVQDAENGEAARRVLVHEVDLQGVLQASIGIGSMVRKRINEFNSQSKRRVNAYARRTCAGQNISPERR